MRHCRDVLTEAEKQDGSAWERALYAVADSLRGQGLDDLGLVVEARMPNNNARADSHAFRIFRILTATRTLARGVTPL